MDSPSTNTTGITACASMDFPHERILSRDYPKIARSMGLIIAIYDLFPKNFFFQTIETFEYIKVRRCCHLREFLRSGASNRRCLWCFLCFLGKFFTKRRELITSQEEECNLSEVILGSVVRVY